MAGVFKLILEASVSAGVLILLALSVRLLIGRRPGIILPLLSVLIIVRLAVPIIIPSPLSLQNLLTDIAIPQSEVVAEPDTVPDSLPVTTDVIPQTDGYETESAEIAGGDIITSNISGSAAEKETTAVAAISFMDACSIAWVAGMALMAAFVILSNVRFVRELKKNRAFNAPGFAELLEACKKELNIQRNIKTVQASYINTAAVYGIFRPRLLVSPSFGWLSEEEKRNVLLHELSHIKRGDTVLSLLITVLNIVHWFNPLVWAALSLARKDIEVMCDMAVLKKTADRRGYAETLLNLARISPKKPKLAEALFAWGPQNGHFGVLVSTYSIKRRIAMIARYKKNPFFTALALVLTVAIAITGCTGAVSPETTASAEVLSPETTESTGTTPQGNIPATDDTQVEYSGTYTLKDNSLSVSIPEGWTAKDATDNVGYLYNRDSDIKIQISSMEITGTPYTPGEFMDITFISDTGEDGQPVILNFEILSTQSVITEGVKGKVFEIGAPLENDEEMRGLEAIYVGSYKYYFCSLSSNNKGDFEKYEPIFYNLLDTLDFEPNDWRVKFADRFTDGVVEKTDNSYESANMNISIEKKEKDGSVFFVADIYVAEPKYFKTAFPGNPENMSEKEPTDIIAKGKNAIIAINGDNFVINPGPVVRNGINYRSEKAGDVLVMNYDGSMQTYSADQIDLTKIEREGAYQVWTFGPMLLKDGQPMTEFNSPQNINGKNPRTALGYYEPGHYCFVVVDGRQPGYSEGLTLEQLSQVFYDLGCTAAYNLQGGNASEMVFMGEIVNQPYMGGRKTPDIIFIGE